VSRLVGRSELGVQVFADGEDLTAIARGRQVAAVVRVRMHDTANGPFCG
jgi:hypothetical protein